MCCCCGTLTWWDAINSRVTHGKVKTSFPRGDPWKRCGKEIISQFQFVHHNCEKENGVVKNECIWVNGENHKQSWVRGCNNRNILKKWVSKKICKGVLLRNFEFQNDCKNMVIWQTAVYLNELKLLGVIVFGFHVYGNLTNSSRNWNKGFCYHFNVWVSGSNR